jgi:hypothetical protein
MIVPQFWAEARVQTRRDGRQFTVRRFGWSDTSPAEAQAIADARVAEAMERLLRGESLARREPKVPYNGAAGVPIREEIVARHGETVLTRNAYGARCLNTPNVLFADVDFPQPFTLPIGCTIIAVLAAVGAGIEWIAESRGRALGLVALAAVAALPVAAWIRSVVRRPRGGPEAAARATIAWFIEATPEWAVRLYRTPAGLRLLVTHRPFEPNDPAVREFFDAVGTDPLYVRMCRNQQCFRARVSPKPWRIGIETHMKPRPGVWPVRPERLPERRAWIEAYEAAAEEFAACEFVEALGSGIVHPQVAPVVTLHDELSRAGAGLPIA